MRPVNPTSRLRLPARLLTLLVVVAAAMLVATGAVGPAAAAAATAPGSAATDVETAVGAHGLTTTVLVGPFDGITAGQRRDNRLVAAVTAVGSRVAPNTTGGARLWSRTEFKGTRVYQRNDLIDPSVADRLGRTNVQRMQQGLAPIGPDGNPLNLHHMIQRPDGPVAELTQSFHQANSRVIHINPNTVPSGIDRSAFGSWRQSYWRSRVCDFGGC